MSVIVLKFLLTSFLFVLSGCADPGSAGSNKWQADTLEQPQTVTNESKPQPEIKNEEETVATDVHPDSVVAFAKTLIGIPYLYASTDPKKGFDCSGFITYVFNHFGKTVPRSSVDFTDYGKEITLADARPGDLILFTGTDSTIRIVGHMGIVENQKQGVLNFIHSSSGKANGVVISELGNYYKGRFVKVIRVFPDYLFK